MTIEVTKQKLQLSKNYESIKFINNIIEAEGILKTNHKQYQKGPGHELVKMMAGEGLLVSEGDLWKKQRQSVHRQFSCDENGFFTDAITDSIRVCYHSLYNSEVEQISINPLKLANSCTLNVFTHALFKGELPSTDTNHILHWLIEEQDRDLRFAKKFRHL